MSKDLTKNLGELNGSVKSYIQTKIDLVKLTLLSKTTRFTSYLFSFLIVLMFVTLIIVFAATAFTFWYGQTYNGDYFTGLLIAGGALILMALVFILLRKQIVTNSVLKNFSEIIFEEDEETQS
jgi:uncharacterized membrane protein